MNTPNLTRFVWLWQVILLHVSVLSLLPTNLRVNAFVVPDPIIHFSVGAVAGGMGSFAYYPFDYIKSQMQTKEGSKKFKNGWHAFCCTVKENPLQLYKGVGVQVLGEAPEKGIKLGVNDVLRTSFLTTVGGFPMWAQVASGAAAGACQVVATSPLEVMKVGMQTSDMTFGQVWKNVGGLKGLFRGADACMLRDIIWSMIGLPLYAMLVNSGMNAFVAGALSGVLACGLTTPPDVIKTRILSHHSTDSTPNPIAMACQIVEQEGVGALFSGVHERCLGAIPRFGTTFIMKDFLGQVVSNAGWISVV